MNLGLKDLQVAYAVTDNIGLLVNGFYKNNVWIMNSGDFENKFVSSRYLFEGGLGYYSKMGGSGRFDLYGGAGLGGFSYNYDLLEAGTLIETNTFDASMFRFIIQPSIVTQNETVGFAISTRHAAIHFSSIKYVAMRKMN